MEDLIEDIKKEHEIISQELDELEVSFSPELINYPNLVHTFRKIIAIWDEHEKKEEELFREMYKKNYGIPYKKMLFEHGILGRKKNLLIRAINSGNHAKIKESLETTGRKIISLLRKHMELENEILYRIPDKL